MRITMDELCNRVEAILFASGKGVTEEELAKYCEVDDKAVKKTLAQLQQDLEKREGSLIVSLHNNRWKMTVRGKYLKDVENIVNETELSGPILRTLAVVAYKSPILQADVVNMRGQSAYEHIKELAKQKFLTKDERGRSFLLKITDKFYNYFDVEGDEEIQEVFSKLREKQKTLGNLQIVDAKPGEEKKQAKKEAEEDKNHLGELDVIEIAPRTREKTEEDEKKEKDFLTRIDEGINAISKRVDEHKLPKHQREEQEENEEVSEKGAEGNKKKELTKEQKQTKKEAEEDPLKAMETFAENQEEKEDKKYL